MKKQLGLMLLGVWLLGHGLMQLIHFSFSGLGTVMAILAIAAGVLLILGR
jgi:hypothetical protein